MLVDTNKILRIFIKILHTQPITINKGDNVMNTPKSANVNHFRNSPISFLSLLFK